jgi:hypothetical protein
MCNESSEEFVDRSRPDWFKSSHSGAPNNECLECSRSHTGHILVRDSKDQDSAVITFAAAAWAEFSTAIRTGLLP